jgi:peptidoglycan-N-acetylglucosamine deacetylase
MTRPARAGACLLTLVACYAALAAATPLAPQVSRRPAPDIFGSRQQVAVSTVEIDDAGTSPDYVITARVPAFPNEGDRRAEAFGAELLEFVRGLTDQFKQEVAKTPHPPVKAASRLDVKFVVVSPPGHVLSLKFETEGYLAGAAHPYHSVRTFTYDLEEGKDVALPDLFGLGRDYLGPISRYCAAQLSTRNIGFGAFSQGADPMPENYRNWNITAGGLLITFDEAQVAPYAAGPQVVTVPYEFLSDVIDTKGPLAILAIRR